MRDTHYRIYKAEEVTDSMLQDAAVLFGENYGVWSEKALGHAKPGTL